MITLLVILLCGVVTGLGAFIIFLAIRGNQVKFRNKNSDLQVNFSRSINVLIAPKFNTANLAMVCADSLMMSTTQSQILYLQH